jgi:regulator of replication initiation timing
MKAIDILKKDGMYGVDEVIKEIQDMEERFIELSYNYEMLKIKYDELLRENTVLRITIDRLTMMQEPIRDTFIKDK